MAPLLRFYRFPRTEEIDNYRYNRYHFLFYFNGRRGLNPLYFSRNNYHGGQLVKNFLIIFILTFKIVRQIYYFIVSPTVYRGVSTFFIFFFTLFLKIAMIMQ